MTPPRTKLGKRGRKMGRPSLGAAARTRIVTLKLSRTELAAVRAAIRKQGAGATVSSWFRDHGLAPFGLGGLARRARKGMR
jgi:hypothetical protein